jgi:serine/threonine-protein kinase
MGEVYRARDTRLERDVALKVLPPEVAHDAERVGRFEREAKLLATLNHPNVAAIHGFEEVDGTAFLAMELVNGEDLSRRIERGPIPVEEACALAVQMTHGLQAAHDQGVVHRDLKPSNVMITPDDEVKILDFGLARAMSSDPGSAEALSESPTLTTATRAGVLLGTAPYMSPEQARGRQADQRSDIWSFGAVLFEMLSGSRPFAGPTVTDVLAAVVRGEPDWEALPASTPPSVRRLLERCLHKDRRLRLQAIGDARFDLESRGAKDEDVAIGAGRKVSRIVAAALIAAAAAAGLWLGGRTFAPGETSTAPVRSTIRMPSGVRLSGWASPAIAISPDGRTLAYVGEGEDGKHLYVRRLDSFDTVRVPDSEWAEGPFFSPDGALVAFANGSVSGGGSDPPRLRSYSVADGTTRVICDVYDYFGGTWLDDGTIVYADLQPGGLRRVDAEGGSPQVLSEGKSAIPRSVAWPQGLPGGRDVLVTVWEGAEGGRAYTVDLDSGAYRDLGVVGHMARFLPTGHLVVERTDRRLEAMRFDIETGRVVGAPVAILSDVSMLGNSAGAFAFSDDGTLAYTTGPVSGSQHVLTVLALVRWDGSLEQLPFDPDFFTSASMSPEGSRVAATTNFGGLLVLDLKRRTRLALPVDDSIFSCISPLWSPDGTEIVFTGHRGDEQGSEMALHVQRADGEGAPRALNTPPGEFYPTSWVPGAGRVLFWGWEAVDSYHSKAFELELEDSGELVELKLSASEAARPMVSPDGRWLAYSSSETGSDQVYLRTYPDLGPKIAVGEGLAGYWSPDMRSLFVRRSANRSNIGSLWVVDIDWSDPDGPALGLARHVADLSRLRGLSPDGAGRGFLGLFEVEGSGLVTDINLVQGWFGEVQRLLPER